METISDCSCVSDGAISCRFSLFNQFPPTLHLLQLEKRQIQKGTVVRISGLAGISLPHSHPKNKSQKGYSRAGKGAEMGNRNDQSLKHFPHEAGLRGLWLFSLEKNY